jgi:hypothetical protein
MEEPNCMEEKIGRDGDEIIEEGHDALLEFCLFLIVWFVLLEVYRIF